jgi:acetyl-CoA synthetase
MVSKLAVFCSKGEYGFNTKKYNRVYKESIENPGKYWGELAEKELFWFKKWDSVYEKKGFKCRWFEGGKTNITFNCLDRHLADGGDKIAYIWTNEQGEERKITYKELFEKVCKTSLLFKKLGVRKGDIVTVYMPQIIEQVISILACARIGAIHSVVYAGFSYQALSTRMTSADSRYLITADFTYRRGKKVDLLEVAREAAKESKTAVKKIVLVRESTTKLQENEISLEKETSSLNGFIDAQVMDAEDPLFILYTSGTTGKPKGIVHTVGGYSLYAHITTKYTFDVRKDDVYWCTADNGWITGHSYIIYGPLSNHMTSILYEGAPDYPTPETWWKIIEKYGATIFYTSPTAIRMLMSYGDKYPKGHNLTTLRLIGSVGEPLNSSAWLWYHKIIGQGKCSIVDTWWQTETGGHMITTLPGLDQKPGYAGLPYFGIVAKVVDRNGKEKKNGEKGNLIINGSWPSVLRDCWHDKKCFEGYYQKIKDCYFTGDIAVKDNDGYIRILGRSDDVIQVAGHGISSAEIESVVTSHKSVVEAAAIGVPDAIKGYKIIVYAVLVKSVQSSEDLEKEIIGYVGKVYGKHGRPERVEFVDKLPKTRSGKIMRRVLKAEEEKKNPGDISTLEN